MFRSFHPSNKPKLEGTLTVRTYQRLTNLFMRTCVAVFLLGILLAFKLGLVFLACTLIGSILLMFIAIILMIKEPDTFYVSLIPERRRKERVREFLMNAVEASNLPAEAKTGTLDALRTQSWRRFELTDAEQELLEQEVADLDISSMEVKRARELAWVGRADRFIS